MHWAAVRVGEASINARTVLFGRYLFGTAHRISQGDLERRAAAALGQRHVRLSVSNEPLVDVAAGAFGSGFDRLRVKRKTATLHRLCLDPVLPDM